MRLPPLLFLLVYPAHGLDCGYCSVLSPYDSTFFSYTDNACMYQDLNYNAVPCPLCVAVAGYYCDASDAMRPCPAGSACPKAGLTQPLACVGATFSLEGSTACSLCGECVGGETYAHPPCAPSSDIVCAACRAVCPDGTFASAECTVTADVVCSGCGRCAPGTRLASACTPWADATCAPCADRSFCPGGDAPQQLCTSACAPGTYEVAGCTPPADRVCANCEPGATFCPTGASPFNCSVCGVGTYESAPCTPFADRECTPCSEGYYCMGAAHFPQSCDAECAPGAYELTACGPSTARTCGACVAGSFCNETNQRRPHPCPAGTSSAAGALGCTACEAGTFSWEGSRAGCQRCPPHSSSAEGTPHEALAFLSPPIQQYATSSSPAVANATLESPTGWEAWGGLVATPTLPYCFSNLSSPSRYVQLDLARPTMEISYVATGGGEGRWACGVRVDVANSSLGPWTVAVWDEPANSDPLAIVAVWAGGLRARFVRVSPTCGGAPDWAYPRYFYHARLRVGLQVPLSGCACDAGYAKAAHWVPGDGFRECLGCGPGTFSRGASCEACGAGTYSNASLASACAGCSEPACRGDEFLWPCNATVDSRCLPCPQGAVFCNGSRVVTPCAPPCPRYEVRACTSTTDRECAWCPRGFFCTPEGGAPTPCGPACATGTHEVVACNASDRVCRGCDAEHHCANGTQRPCRAPCEPGWREAVACTNATDRQCAGCAEGHFCANGTQQPCSPECAAGTHQTDPCTNATDRRCAACEAGSFCVNATRRPCGPECVDGTYRTAPCTNATVRRCAACEEGWFCANETRRRCAPPCANGTHEGADCTNATDRRCEACGAEHHCPNATRRPCTPPCAPGTHETAPCTPLGDRACGRCDNGPAFGAFEWVPGPPCAFRCAAGGLLRNLAACVPAVGGEYTSLVEMRPAESVCGAVAGYVARFCMELSLANPAELVACRADSVDGVACGADDTCAAACAAPMGRRLLLSSQRLTIRATHALEPTIRLPPAWPDPVAVVSTSGGPALLNGIAIVAGIVVALLGLLLACQLRRGRGAAAHKKTDEPPPPLAELRLPVGLGNGR